MNLTPTTTVPPASTEMKRRAMQQFDRWADSYDRSILHFFLFKPSYLTLVTEIARWHSENPKPFSLLDVGCGTGELAGYLAHGPLPVTTVGLDYAANMCVSAAAKFTELEGSDRPQFINGDSEHLPFADGSFDMITCSNSFHHYPHQQNVVSEMMRLLSPGGRLIIIDGFRDCVVGWFVFDVVIAKVEGDVHHAPWPLMTKYFETAGLTGIRRRKFNFIFPACATIGDKPKGA